MAVQGRQAWVFVAGALLGGAVAVAAYLAWFTPSRTLMPTPGAALPAQPIAAPAPAAAPAAVPAMATAPAGTCAFEPLVARSNERDGQFALDAALSIQRSGDPAPFLAVADEAAREGRARDAEVALMAACRIAGMAGPTSAPTADTQSRLAHHYANIAARQTDDGTRAQLLDRAEALLGSSVQAYTAALGRQSSKTRMAQQQLASLRQPAQRVLSVAGSEPPAPVTQDVSRMGASRLSLAERPVRQDEPVGELENDIERLYSQARAVSRDPAGLERRQQQALAQRNACRGDEECLRTWATQRKRQLFSEFSRR